MIGKTMYIVNKIITAFNEKNTSNVFSSIDELYDYVGYTQGEQILSMIDEIIYNAREL